MSEQRSPARRAWFTPSEFSFGLSAAAPFGSAVSLAALGTPTTIDPETVRRTVLPAPATVALAASSDAAGGLWGVLGEASGRATIEALARSGRLLQPELVLEAMRSMGGYEPVAAAPLAYGRARTHGWAPALDSALPPTPTTAIAGSDPLPGAKP